MSHSPKVTVIIPVYNSEKYLRECLDSVCNQTYTNLEVICVDDGSTDDSAKILHEYAQKDKRFVIITQENKGQAVARNTALDKSTGEWVTGLDSDDYLRANAVERAVLCIENDVDIVSFDFLYFYEDTSDKLYSIPIPRNRQEGKQKPTRYTVRWTSPEFWGKLWRRSMLEAYEIRFPEGLHFEDLAYSKCALSIAKNIYVLNEHLYIYRRRHNSTFHTYLSRKGGRKVLDYLAVAEYCLSFWEKVIQQGKIVPEHIQIDLIEHLRYWLEQCASEEFQYDAWNGIRAIIHKYALTRDLPLNPKLASYYYLPGYAKQALLSNNYNVNTSKQVNAIRTDMLLLANESKIFWKYQRTKLLSIITWGKTRRKYKEKKKHYKNAIRRCRELHLQPAYKQYINKEI